MAGPKDQTVRQPAVAGFFYPADADRCRAVASQLLHDAQTTPTDDVVPHGGIVPHAGWVCSGAIAAQTIAAIAAHRRNVDLVVVLGAIHTPIPVEVSVFDSHSRWQLPGGESGIVTAVRDELVSDTRRFAIDDRFHRREHAVEVELPLIQQAWPSALVLPIEVPPVDGVVETGRQVARWIADAGLNAVYLASSDLTHYGPDYRFTPAGIGEDALRWAWDNDERLLRVVTNMTPEFVLQEAKLHHNACGAGAIAAMMAACQTAGARSAAVLKHTNSFQTLSAIRPQEPDNAVGYASVIVGT